MASFVFNQWKGPKRDFDTPGSGRYLVKLVEGGALVEGTEQDADTESALSGAFDEPDDASYSFKVATDSVNVDDTGNVFEILLSAVTWTALAGSETIYGALVLYDPDSSDTAATNQPIAWCEFASTYTSNGADLTVQFDGTDPGVVVEYS